MRKLVKIGVTGGRNYTNREIVWSALNTTKTKLESLDMDMHLIVGDATGADATARLWADVHNVPKTVYEAKWSLYGKAAGPRRNREMADSGISFLHAFPGNNGTYNMIKLCLDRRIPMKVHKE